MVDSKKHERVCTCGKIYKYCPSCSEYEHMEPWHLRWCSKNCMEIDTTLSNWGAHLITSKEAAEKLKTLDTSRMEYWNDNFKAAYNQVMAEAAGAEPKPTPLDEFKEKETAMLKKQKEEQVKPFKKGVHTTKTTTVVAKSSKEKEDAK